MSDNKKFSLIMATLGRDSEVCSFCKSLDAQSYRNFELIIVDQNEDDRLVPVVNDFKNKFSIKYIRSSEKGLSHNRNIGLQYADGDIIAFPDDDCEYLNDTLEFVLKELELYDFVTVNSADIKNRSLPKFSCEKNMHITVKNFFKVGISYGIFINTKIFYGFLFDEKLGVGAKFGAGEDSDLILYLLSNKRKGFYFGNYFVLHPYKPLNDKDKKRAFSYGRGFGAIYKKSIFVYHNIFHFFNFCFSVIKNFIGIMVSSKRKYHLVSLQGKISGFTLYK